MTQRLTNGRVFDGEQVFAGRDVIIDGGIITDIVASGGVGGAETIDLGDQLGYVRPGYRASLMELDSSLCVHRSWVDGDLQRHIVRVPGYRRWRSSFSRLNDRGQHS